MVEKVKKKKKKGFTLDGKEYYTYPGGPTDLFNKLQKEHEKEQRAKKKNAQSKK